MEGIDDPEKKRKIIGRDFVEVFNAEAKKITDAKWLAQGTIYPDRIESLNITGKVIKAITMWADCRKRCICSFANR